MVSSVKDYVVVIQCAPHDQCTGFEVFVGANFCIVLNLKK